MFESINMAANKVGLKISVIFVALFLIITILGSQKCNKHLSNDANIVYVSTGLDINHFPSRNSCLSRKYTKASRVAPSLKCVIVIKLGNISLCAASLVLLSGDVMSNPGPVSDPFSVCNKGCRKNQKAIQCDSFDGWFHAKCIGMDSNECIELSDNSKRWECIQCLFPVCDSPTKGSGNSSNINIQNESSINASAEINPDLINNGNCTEWSAIWSEIKRVITKSHDGAKRECDL